MTEQESRNLFLFFKGRVALYAILKAIGIKPGDEIILPGFTCLAVPNAIIYLGARPVYVDIDPKTYNIDPEKIESGKGKIWEVDKAKAIIAQHTFGIPADMDSFIDIANKYKLYVVEDSCHAIGSKYKGKEVGTFGDAAFFSAQWSKPITTGLGGWAVVNNKKIESNIKKIYHAFLEPSFKDNQLLRLQYLIYSTLVNPSSFWFAQNTYRTLSKLGIALGSSSNEELNCTMPKGYQKKMSTWQKNLLKKKIKEIDRHIEHRKWVTSVYESLLNEKGINTLRLPDYYNPVFLRYPLLAKDKRKIIQDAKRRNIELGDWFLSPVHPNLYGWERVSYQRGQCPIAEDICNHIINLPTHIGINQKKISTIIEFLEDNLSFFSNENLEIKPTLKSRQPLL
jgi:dTDP-4-amino-4,6-dideoxygalactose transaminase